MTARLELLTPVADDVEGVVIAGSGPWLIDEAPDQVIPRLTAFFQP